MDHSDLFYEKLEWNCVLDAMYGDLEYDDDDEDEDELE